MVSQGGIAFNFWGLTNLRRLGCDNCQGFLTITWVWLDRPDFNNNWEVMLIGKAANDIYQWVAMFLAEAAPSSEGNDLQTGMRSRSVVIQFNLASHYTQFWHLLSRSIMNYQRFYLITIVSLITNLATICSVAKIARADPQPNSIDRVTNSTSTQNFVSQGTEIFLNGKTLNIPWGQWQIGTNLRLGIGDTALDRQLGVELFSNSNYQTQPIDWYGTTRLPKADQRSSTPVSVTAKLSRQYRYLDITDLAKRSGWQWQIVGTKLQLNTPATKVTNVRRENSFKNGKITVTLDRATPWKLSQTPTEGYLTIAAIADPKLLAQFNAPAPTFDSNLDPDDDPTAQQLAYKITSDRNQTIIQFPIV